MTWMSFVVALGGCSPGSSAIVEAIDHPNGELAADATAPLVASSRSWVEGRDCALSCHTTHAFVLASPHLGPEAEPVRDAILQRVAERVEHWPDARLWYASSTQKAAESRGTESVLNAFALATQDHPAAPQAIANLASTQRPDGAWDWLDFGLAPWEDSEAEVAGAALAAIALAHAEQPPEETVSAVRKYLVSNSTELDSLHNALALLWSDMELGRTIACKFGAATERFVRKQQRRDGSWDKDPYLTAFATFVLAGRGGDEAAAAVARGRTWLRGQQSPSGEWRARSPNSRDDFNQQLATDAATAFAVLALGERTQVTPRVRSICPPPRSTGAERQPTLEE